MKAAAQPGGVRRARIAADHVHAAAEHGMIEDDVGGGQHQNGSDDRRRNTDDGAAAERVGEPFWKIENRESVRERRGESHANAQHAEGDHEWIDPEHGDADAIDHAGRDTGTDADHAAGEDGKRHSVRIAADHTQHDESAGDAHQGDQLADGEIEAAGQQREHLPRSQDREVAALLENVDGVLARMKCGLDKAEAEIHQRDDDGQRTVKKDDLKHRPERQLAERLGR